MTASEAATAVRRILTEACERDPEYTALVMRELAGDGEDGV